jgi:uncharacterized protein (TIGR02145 family)
MADKRKARPQSIAEFLALLDDNQTVTPVVDEDTFIGVKPNEASEATEIEIEEIEDKSTSKQQPQPTPKRERKSKKGLLLLLFALVVATIAAFILLGDGSSKSGKPQNETLTADTLSRHPSKRDSITPTQSRDSLKVANKRTDTIPETPKPVKDRMATSAENATAVDLGLPSGIKWATYNVGAISPEDCGYYYAWGEIDSKDNYTKDSSKTRGQKMDDDISGNEKYDAATVNWGEEWRMPTNAEFKDLVESCSWTWKKHKGVWGYEVKSKQNDNSIFLPAAGYCQKNMKNEEGLVGSYWSSTFDGINRAYLLYFNESDPDASRLGRYDGFSVRPVTRTPKTIE